MEENTQLPKEVVEQIKTNAALRCDRDNGKDDNSFRNGYYSGYVSGATAYAAKLHQANEVIKALEYDNNLLKGEVEGLRTAGDEASGYIEFLDVQNNRLRKMLSDICEKAGAGTEIEKMIVEFFKDINTERESAAGREDDKAHFDNWHRWLSDNGYTYDGEYYYDEDNNYFTPDQLWVKFK